MDIENMHPFCLPFGLCHDATSSTSIIAADLAASPNQNNQSSDGSGQAAAAGLNQRGEAKERRLSSQRSKSSSPSDELFRQLNNNISSSASAIGQSLLSHDLIIGSSASLDIIGAADESFYSSLDLDDVCDQMNASDDDHDENRLLTRKSSIATELEFTDSDQKLDEDEDDYWYCNEYSLFSPTRRKSASTRATAFLNHQVFQHLVDPIDIKSSPTLAQLNLNSNDDPIDGFWDTTTSTAPGGPTNSINHNNNNNNNSTTDLLSNCTSINKNTLTGAGSCCSHHTLNHHHHHHHHAHHNHSGESIVCNHLNNDHHHQHINNSNTSSSPQHHLSSSSSYSSLAHLTSCHHQHMNHNQHHHHQSQYHQDQQLNKCTNSIHQSTCLAVTPFKESDIHQNHSNCCHNSASANQLSLQPPQPQQQNPINNGPNLKPSAALNQLNQQQQTTTCARQLATNATAQAFSEHGSSANCGAQKRPSSPVLVTSSSSPLSTSAPNQHQQQQQQQYSASSDSGAMQMAENIRSVDNKLKENIEYLTALLCNGNKLDSNNQQASSISSTMARSYATLAHSLSTGPKLLERGQQDQLANSLTAAAAASPAQIGSTIANPTTTTNEAAPSMEANLQQDMRTSLKRPHSEHHAQQQQQQQQQWIKVESSVSAADSTDGQTIHTAARIASESLPSPACFHHIQQQPQSQVTFPHMDSSCPQQQQQQQQRAPNLRVLSSLLNSGNGGGNKCANHQGCGAHHHGPPNSQSPCPVWPPSVHHRNQHHQQQQQAAMLQPQTTTVDSGVIGPPATPTDIQQQQQLIHHHHHHHHQQHHQQQTQSQQPQRASSIPPHGRPITLTPIASHNNPILQQQQQQQQQQLQALASKVNKASPFVQPASPSASSTASSVSANTDAGSSGSSAGPTAIKRPRVSHGGLQASGALGKGQRSANGGGGGGSSSGGGRPARPNSMSTECSSLSSHDEGFSSQIDNDDCQDSNDRDSDDDDEVDSDDESFYGDYTNNDLIGASISDDVENKWTLNMGRTRRNGQKRYFWQYNVQSKGPKGTRICSADESEDPFVLPEASDPVFSNDCQVEGVKHSGKARRGDGNDLTPNPRKLLMIGLELKKLGKIINELAPVTDLPINARTKTRKEKNKLASRACRLKKKAQHEANKIKLYGLQREHQQVVMAIYDVRKLLNQALVQRDNNRPAEGHLQAHQRQSCSPPAGQQNPTDNSRQLTSAMAVNSDSSNKASATTGTKAAAAATTTTTTASVFSIAEQCSMHVAGQTSDFVNSVLEKVVSGCIDGGLET